MAKKYIVKNCPCIYSKHYKCDGIYYGLCKECTDCLIKQVIEKCNEQFGLIDSDYREGKRDVALEILELFKIEEVNNNE